MQVYLIDDLESKDFPQHIIQALIDDDCMCENRIALVVEHENKIILIKYDGGEPEDNTFYRDWNWIPEAIEKAYNLGYSTANSDSYNPYA